MNMNNIIFKNNFFITRKKYKSYIIENKEDLEYARIVGKGTPEIININFDYEVIKDKIMILNNELDYKNNPYVSKQKLIQQNAKKVTAVNTILLKFIKTYGIPNTDDSVNIKDLIIRIYNTNKLIALTFKYQLIAWDELNTNDLGNSYLKPIEIEKFNNQLITFSRYIYENTKEYPIFPQLYYNEQNKKVEIGFTTKSILSMLNFNLILECADNDYNYNTCKYCNRVFRTENRKTKICNDKNCIRERKRLYQKSFRDKKKLKQL